MMGLKKSSSIGHDLLSAMPNDDARNKNESLEVHSVVILGSGKGRDNGRFAPMFRV
jgi:hypothetical protein